MCAAAIGTETDGSIVCPSNANGIVGIKPTVGLVSRAGIIPVSHSQDTAGPMARCVADAAAVLGTLTGVDPRDPATQGSQGNSHNDYTQFLDPHGLKGARLGVARSLFGFSPDVDQIMENCLQAIRDLGAELVDPLEIETPEEFEKAEYEVLLYDFKTDLNAYLASLEAEAQVHSLNEVIEFNESNSTRVMPYFGQERMLKACDKGPLSDEAYIEARETCLRIAQEEGIDALLQEHQLDAILAPSGGPAT